MKLNMGTADRVIRIMLASIMAALFFWDVVTGNFAILLISVASIFALTSVVGICPLYSAVGMNSCTAEDHYEH